jgi:segregation and condensation protein B
MNTLDAKRVLETALICADQPMPLRDMRTLFDDALGLDTLRTLLDEIARDLRRQGHRTGCTGQWLAPAEPA